MMGLPRRSEETIRPTPLVAGSVTGSPQSISFGLRLWFCSSRVQKNFPHQSPLGLICSTKDHRWLFASGSWPSALSPLCLSPRRLAPLAFSASAFEIGMWLVAFLSVLLALSVLSIFPDLRLLDHSATPCSPFRRQRSEFLTLILDSPEPDQPIAIFRADLGMQSGCDSLIIGPIVGPFHQSRIASDTFTFV